MTWRRLVALAAVVALTAGCTPAASGVPGASTSPAATAAAARPTTGPATPMPSSLGFDHGWLAFMEGLGTDADTVVHVMRLDGSEARVIPRPAGQSQTEGPAWIPGTEALLFDSNRAGAIHLFRYDLATGAVVQVTRGDRFEGYPAVSPDGTTIAIDWGTATTSLGIALVPMTGGEPRTLVPPPDPPAFDSAPAFSPDGRQLAFIRKRSQQPPHALEAGFVVNVDGTGLRQVTPFDLDVGRIRWSPDGQWLVFANNYENRSHGGVVDLYRVHPDGSGLEQLTHSPAGTHLHDAEFLPDGLHLVAIRQVTGHDDDEIVTMNLDGSDQRVIATGDHGTFFAWVAWTGD